MVHSAGTKSNLKERKWLKRATKMRIRRGRPKVHWSGRAYQASEFRIHRVQILIALCHQMMVKSR
jgi:hypothetical protein